MWTEKTFNLTRREIRTSRPFEDVVAAIEARAPVVVQETNHQLLGNDTIDAIGAGRLDSADLRRRVEARLGSSGFMLLMKIEHDLLMGDLGRKHRSVQYAIGNPLIAKDVSDAAPKVCLYTPLRLAVLDRQSCCRTGGRTLQTPTPGPESCPTGTRSLGRSRRRRANRLDQVRERVRQAYKRTT